MAKRKTLRELSEELQGTNQSVMQSIDSLNKRMDFIENTSLAIMEILRRKGTGSSALDNGSKVKNINNNSSRIAKNPLIQKQDNTSTSGVLSQLYMFLTKKSEKDERDRKERKDFEKQKTKEIEKRYEKVFKSKGFKFTKTKGILGKTLTGLKWTTIGLAISGLVWLFKEEITNFSNTFKEEFKSFANFIKDKITRLVSIFDSVKKIIIENPIFQMMNSQYQKFKESLTSDGGILSIVDSLIEDVEKLAKQIYDDISAWVGGVVEQVIKIIQNPLDYSKIIADVGILLTKGPVGMAARAIAATEAISKTTTFAGEEFSRSIYGNESYDKMKKFLDGIPDDIAKRAIKDYLFEIGDYSQWIQFGANYKKGLTDEQKSKAVQLLLKYPELRERLASSGTNIDKLYGKGIDVVPNVLEQIGIGETRQQSFEKQTGLDAYKFASKKRQELKEFDLSLENWAKEKIIKNLDEYEYIPLEQSTYGGITIKNTKTGVKINSIMDPVEFARVVARASAFEYGSEKTQELKNQIGEWKNKVQNLPWFKALESEVKNIEQQATALKETYAPQIKSKIIETSDAVSREVSSSYEGAKTPADKVSSTVGLLGKGIGAVGDLFVQQAGPSAKKVDLSKIIDKSFDYIETGFAEATALSTKINQPGGFEDLIKQVLSPTGDSDEIGKLLPELKRDTISPDPNEDPNNIWSGIKESFGANISNNVLNTGKSSTQTQHQGSIACRMNNPSFQNSSILNSCRP